MSYPQRIWPNTATDDPMLAWLRDNQSQICKVWPAWSPMTKPRPILFWKETGKVRVAFVGTWDSAEQAVEECKARIVEFEANGMVRKMPTHRTGRHRVG